MPKSRRKNLLLASSSLSQGFLLNPQTSLERPAGLKTNRQRYFANQTTSMRITEQLKNENEIHLPVLAEYRIQLE